MQSNIAMGRYIEEIKDAEEQIKDVLSANPEKEVSKKTLLNATTLEQSTIYRATLRLQAKNEIKIIRRGQRTSYMIMDPVKIDTVLGATLFGKTAIQKLLNFHIPIISDDELYHKIIKESNYNNNNNNDLVTIINKNTKFFQHKFIKEKDDIERFLFEFSNRIGAFIVYTMITSMHPNNELFKKIDLDKRDKIISDWIINSISSIVLNMMKRYFNEEVYKSLKKYQLVMKKNSNFLIKNLLIYLKKRMRNS